MEKFTNDPSELSKQEREILQRIAEGKPNRRIADDMCLSTHTIKNHKANIIKKLGLGSTIALFTYALNWAKQKVSNQEAKTEKDEGGGVKC